MLSHQYCMCKSYTVDYVAIPDHHLEFLCLQTCNLSVFQWSYFSISNFQMNGLYLARWAKIRYSIKYTYELTKTTCVGVIVGTLTFKMPVGVHARCRWMTTVRTMITFIDVMTIVSVCLIARFTFAIVPTGHIHAIRCRFTCVQTSCTFIQIFFTRSTNVSHTTRTNSRQCANATVQAGIRANCCEYAWNSREFQKSKSLWWNQSVILTLTVESVALEAIFAATVVRALRIYTFSIFMARMLTSGTFI